MTEVLYQFFQTHAKVVLYSREQFSQVFQLTFNETTWKMIWFKPYLLWWSRVWNVALEHRWSNFKKDQLESCCSCNVGISHFHNSSSFDILDSFAQCLWLAIGLPRWWCSQLHTDYNLSVCLSALCPCSTHFAAWLWTVCHCAPTMVLSCGSKKCVCVCVCVRTSVRSGQSLTHHKLAAALWVSLRADNRAAAQTRYWASGL